MSKNTADPLRKSQQAIRRAGFLKLEKTDNQRVVSSFAVQQMLFSACPGMNASGGLCNSTGNGRALAHAASTQGLTAMICLSSLVPLNKVEAIRALGADVRIISKSQDDAMEEVMRLVRDESMNAIPPFDDPRIIAGRGTVGFDVEDLPELHTVLVPLSGGGLAAQVAAAVKAKLPQARVVEFPCNAVRLCRYDLEAGKPVNVDELDTLADFPRRWYRARQSLDVCDVPLAT